MEGVYPRACGGTSDSWAVRFVGRGLSPRVRGNPMFCSIDTSSTRSIPARAGEPRVAGSTDRLRRVYPRACGGTCAKRECIIGGLGLSPRVRGNPIMPDNWDAIQRSIPARAGEPAARFFSCSAVAVYPRAGGTASAGEVYPRACGGTPGSGAPIHSAGGLSPRGTHVDDGQEVRDRGLSPRVRGNQG